MTASEIRQRMLGLVELSIKCMREAYQLADKLAMQEAAERRQEKAEKKRSAS